MAVGSKSLFPVLLVCSTLFSRAILGNAQLSASAASSARDQRKAPACAVPLGNQGHAKPNDPFWLEAIKHQGTSPFNPDPANYRVFRNVKVRLSLFPR